jgi:hypothetical protein
LTCGVGYPVEKNLAEADALATGHQPKVEVQGNQ